MAVECAVGSTAVFNAEDALAFHFGDDPIITDIDQILRISG